MTATSLSALAILVACAAVAAAAPIAVEVEADGPRILIEMAPPIGSNNVVLSSVTLNGTSPRFEGELNRLVPSLSSIAAIDDEVYYVNQTSYSPQTIGIYALRKGQTTPRKVYELSTFITTQTYGISGLLSFNGFLFFAYGLYDSATSAPAGSLTVAKYSLFDRSVTPVGRVDLASFYAGQVSLTMDQAGEFLVVSGCPQGYDGTCSFATTGVIAVIPAHPTSTLRPYSLSLPYPVAGAAIIGKTIYFVQMSSFNEMLSSVELEQVEPRLLTTVTNSLLQTSNGVIALDNSIVFCNQTHVLRSYISSGYVTRTETVFKSRDSGRFSAITLYP